MARMIPDSRPKEMPGHLVKVWKQLKSISDDDLVCRISFQINSPAHPDFLLIYKNRSAFLLAVSNATTPQLDGYVQSSFAFEDQTEPPGLEKENSVDLFSKEVLQSLGARGDVPIQHWVLFPNASTAVVNRLKESWQGSPREFLGKSECQSDSLLDKVKKAAQYQISEETVQLISGRFSPESTIPNGWVSQRTESENVEQAQQIDFLLDYDQEDAMKRDLELSGEGYKVASDGKTRLVTGTAGCGKTLILLFRARLSASLDSSQRILVLMHNKPLRADLVNRAKELGMAGHIEWRTFYSWVTSMYGNFDIVPEPERNRFITDGMERLGLSKSLKLEFVVDEFEWISDNGPEPISLDWYLSSARAGRKRSLQEGQRRKVYRLYRSYRIMLDERGLVDWPVLPRIFLKKLMDGELQCKQYHTIYIDEAQFFAPVWFRCVRKALEPERGRFFLVADPTQGFLRSGMSWVKMLGDDMRGRSQRLQKPYRNTREIMTFAKNFYLGRAISEEDEVNMPDEDAIGRMPTGPEPVFVKIERQTAPEIIVKQLKELTERGQSPGHILFIDASGYGEKTQLDLLQKHFPNQVVSASAATDRSRMRVTTIGACTGIESPVVVLVGLDRLLEREEDFGLDAIEREELKKWNTKKVFVAITRAAQKLVIIYRNDGTKKKLLFDQAAVGHGSESTGVQEPEVVEANSGKQTEKTRIELNREKGRPNRHGLPFAKGEKDEICSKYRNGKTIEEIAIEYKRSAYSIAIQLEKIELLTREETKSYQQSPTPENK